MGAWWIGADTVLGLGLRAVLRADTGEECEAVSDVAELGHRSVDGDLVFAMVDRSGVERWDPVREWFRDLCWLTPVAVATSSDERTALSLLGAGWAGVMLATAAPAQVGDACVRLRDGRRAVAGLCAAANERLDDLGSCWPGRDAGLSRRESEVLVGLADGLTAAQIAERLVIGRETVRTHLRTLYRSMGVGDRGAAVAEGFRLRIIG